MQAKPFLMSSLKGMMAVSLLLISLTACTSSAGTNPQGAAESSSGAAANANQAAVGSAAMPAGPMVTSAKHSQMENATPEEVGQSVLASAKQWEVPGTTAEVVLARQVTMDDVSALGLGCYDFASIETPPLMLVILKGNFATGGMILQDLAPDVVAKERATYIAYVIDLWAGQPTIVVASPHGGIMRKALNDPSLPDDNPGHPSNGQPSCPSGTQGEKTLHYGQVAPPAFTPTWDPRQPTPQPYPTDTPMPPTPTFMPVPIGTDVAP